MIKDSQITQSSKFAISLQYLKREVRNGSHFWHTDKRQGFNKLVLFFLKELARHVQNTQNRKLVVFLQYIKKSCRDCFVLYWDTKHSDIWQGSSHVCCYIFSSVILCFSFFMPSKMAQNLITTINHILDVLLILVFIYKVILKVIYTLLLYYMNLLKLIKYGKVRRNFLDWWVCLVLNKEHV